MGRSLRIGRMAGVPIGVHPLWLIVVVLITWSLGAVYYPEEVDGIAPAVAYALGLLSALLLFASILLHEIGHAVVARRHGVEVEEIDLWLLGGVAKMRGMPRQAGDELRFALAGPAVTLAIVVLFGLIVVALPSSTPAEIEAVLGYQLLVNAVILAFNLLPAFPLDGGRVTRALLWQRSGDLERATVLAATVGRAFAYGFIALGVLGLAGGAPGGIWLALIGIFLLMAGSAEASQQALRGALRGDEARDLMAFPAVTIPGELTAAEAAERFFVPHRYRGFPVTEGDTVRGLVTIDPVEALSPQQRAATRVAEIMDTDVDLFVDEHAKVTELLDLPAFQRVGRAIVLTERGKVGILSITDVERAVRAHRLVSAPGEPRPAPR